MARIPLSSGFTLIPEGEHIFRIYDVKYDENFGKMEVMMVTAEGMKHTERFSLMDANGEPNEGALNAFSYFAKTALNDFALEEIDHADLVGHYIRAEVVHTPTPSKKDPTKTVTFANLGDKFPADGFDTQPVAAAMTMAAEAPAPAPAPAAIDLDALLNL